MRIFFFCILELILFTSCYAHIFLSDLKKCPSQLSTEIVYAHSKILCTSWPFHSVFFKLYPKMCIKICEWKQLL